MDAVCVPDALMLIMLHVAVPVEFVEELAEKILVDVGVGVEDCVFDLPVLELEGFEELRVCVE